MFFSQNPLGEGLIIEYATAGGVFDVNPVNTPCSAKGQARRGKGEGKGQAMYLEPTMGNRMGVIITTLLPFNGLFVIHPFYSISLREIRF